MITAQPPYGVEGWQRHEADGDQPIGRQHEPYRWSGLSALGTSGGRRRAHVEDTAVVSEAAGRLDLAKRPKDGNVAPTALPRSRFRRWWD